MNNIQETQKTKPKAKLISRVAPDGCHEILVDVANGYPLKDQLKANGFQFVKAPSDNTGTSPRLDKNGNRKTTPVWRRIFSVADLSEETDVIIEEIEDAVSELENIKKEAFSDTPIAGIEMAKKHIKEIFTDGFDMENICHRLESLDRHSQKKHTLEDEPLTPGE